MVDTDFTSRVLNQKTFSASGNLNNPALQIVMFKDEKKIGRKWVFNRVYGHMGGDDLPFTMQIVKLGGVETSRAGYVTVLDVKSGSGGFLIWAVIIRKSGEADTVHLAMRNQSTDSRFRDRFATLKEF